MDVSDTENILTEVDRLLKPGTWMIVTILRRVEKGSFKNVKSTPYQKVFEIEYLESVFLGLV
jgi:hypothetical protein